MDDIVSTLNGDIVLDEEAFTRASSEFEQLGIRLQNLRSELEEMVDALKAGFNTPAGAKFIKSCERNLYMPLDAQKLVLEHIAQSLELSRTHYETVFREYESLQALINSINNN